MSRVFSMLLPLVVGGVGACATTEASKSWPSPAQTTLVPTSARCQGSRCACRPLDLSGDQSERGIAAGKKRFEFRLPRSTSAIWVKVGSSGVFFKPAKRVDPQCFYVDLSAGTYPIALHSVNRDVEVGLQTGLTIHQYASKQGPRWYRSAHVVCGGGASPCTREELEGWVSFQRNLTRGVLDPCGSVMIRGVRFGGRRDERNDAQYQDLTVRFAMKVYGFEPRQPPGSSKCKAPTPNR